MAVQSLMSNVDIGYCCSSANDLHLVDNDAYHSDSVSARIFSRLNRSKINACVQGTVFIGRQLSAEVGRFIRVIGSRGIQSLDHKISAMFSERHLA